ncbi:MAG: MBL fold metallo-hydrolase, partial [Clostridia bacterium]|nr:MBL fold metallo-hydrolase [Clostridia bacterium]
MFELIPIKGNTYRIQSPAGIGLYRTGEDTVILIDSGSSKDAAKKIRRVLDENHWTLTAIYNTHSHADHIGGNRYLEEQTGCKIYAPGIECAFTQFPILEPAFLRGANPSADLRHKFLLAQDSHAEPLTKDVLPEGFEIVPLPGHYFDMVGFRTPDNVLFLADCLSSAETLDKYGITYLYDVGAYLSTLEAVKTMEADLFVPSHAEVTDNIAPLAQYNIDKVNEVIAAVLELCRTPVTFENLLAPQLNSGVYYGGGKIASGQGTLASAWLGNENETSPDKTISLDVSD